MPAHRFLRGMLDHYGVQLHELPTNEVQQMATFVALCDSFLGTDTHFDLFTYFFKALLVKMGDVMCPFGFCSIQMKQSWVS